MADFFNPLDSASNQIYEKFSNIIKLTEFYGFQGGRFVNEANAVSLRGDVTVSENYSFSANVTSHPVHKDSDVTDNARPEDFLINITAISSDASMSYLDTPQSIANSSVGAFVRTAFTDEQALDNYLSKSQAVFKQLKEWWEKGIPLQIDCVYDIGGLRDANYNTAAFIIQNISIPRTSEIGSRAIKWNMSLKQVRFAQYEKEEISLYSFSKGTKPSTEVDPKKIPNSKQDKPERAGLRLRDRKVTQY